LDLHKGTYSYTNRFDDQYDAADNYPVQIDSATQIVGSDLPVPAIG
jgi:hypothetical protein